MLAKFVTWLLRPQDHNMDSISRVKVGEKRSMSHTDALFMFLFNVCLPTWDVFTDLFFSYTLLQPICNEYYNQWQYYVEKHNWKGKQNFNFNTFNMYVLKFNFDSRCME